MFCDSPIKPNTPPEHVIPQWVGRAYPDAMFAHTDRQGRLIRSKVIEITVDTVCRPCNHHWMSDLETRASPLLKRMLKGQQQGLTVEQQALLAQWATKTAMTLDQVYPPRERLWPPPVCKELMDRELPPPGIGVRLGHYTGSGPFLKISPHDMYSVIPPKGTRPGAPDGHRTPIRIDHLILEVHRSNSGRLTMRIGGTDQAVAASDILPTIWPTTKTTSWPPAYAFNDRTWESFVQPNLTDAIDDEPWGTRG